MPPTPRPANAAVTFMLKWYKMKSKPANSTSPSIRRRRRRNTEADPLKLRRRVTSQRSTETFNSNSHQIPATTVINNAVVDQNCRASRGNARLGNSARMTSATRSNRTGTRKICGFLSLALYPSRRRSVPIDVAQHAVRWLETERPRRADGRGRENGLGVVTNPYNRRRYTFPSVGSRPIEWQSPT